MERIPYDLDDAAREWAAVRDVDVENSLPEDVEIVEFGEDE